MSRGADTFYKTLQHKSEVTMRWTKTLKPRLFVLAFIWMVMVFENTLSAEPQ